MQHYHHLNNLNLLLINFKKPFAEIETKFLNDCTEFGLLKNKKINYRNKDTKRILQHHVIHEICNEVLRHTKYKSVIFYRPFQKDDIFEILQYSNLKDLNKQLLLIVTKIKKLLPIQTAVFDKEISFHGLKEKLNKKDGETVDLVNKILCQMVPTNLSFAKIKKWTKKEGLTFLSENYFNQLKTKQLFY